MTASRLERIRSCHFAYFMEYGLRAKPREPAAFDAPQIGTFLHYLLENVTRDVLAQGGFAAVDNDRLHGLVRQYIDQYAAQELHNFQNRNARFQYLFRRLRNTAYAVIDQVAEELRHSDFIPMAFELSFGGRTELCRRLPSLSRTASCGWAAWWTAWTAGSGTTSFSCG